MATIEEAREYARSLKLKGQKGWQKYVKENDMPSKAGIPFSTL